MIGIPAAPSERATLVPALDDSYSPLSPLPQPQGGRSSSQHNHQSDEAILQRAQPVIISGNLRLQGRETQIERIENTVVTIHDVQVWSVLFLHD